MTPDADRVRATERWFVRRGVPHFISGYNAAEDILTRALPFLIVVFLFELVTAVNLDWPWWANTLAIIAAAALVLGIWGFVNVARGRPRLALPDDVGRTELTVFVLVPAILPLVFGGDVGVAALTVTLNLVVLAAVYSATSYGVVPLTRWGAGEAFRSLGKTLALFARALPILLLFFMFLFINAEAWQTAGTIDTPFLLAAFGLFLAMGVVFVVARIPDEIRRLSHFETPDEVLDLLEGTPIEAPTVGALEQPPLETRERLNVGLVVLFGLGLQIVLVSALVGFFFVVLGLLVVQPSTIVSWTGAEPTLVGPAFELWGLELRLSRELLQVSAFLSAFSGMYFSVFAMTDPALRTDFYETVVADVRRSLAVRAAYLTEMAG